MRNYWFNIRKKSFKLFLRFFLRFNNTTFIYANIFACVFFFRNWYANTISDEKFFYLNFKFFLPRKKFLIRLTKKIWSEFHTYSCIVIVSCNHFFVSSKNSSSSASLFSLFIVSKDQFNFPLKNWVKIFSHYNSNIKWCKGGGRFLFLWWIFQKFTIIILIKHSRKIIHEGDPSEKRVRLWVWVVPWG